MTASIMRARSVEEAHLYMDLRGVARQGREHRLVEVSGELIALYSGVREKERWNFAFDIPEPFGTAGRFGGAAPSEIITPAQFLRQADALTQRIPASAEGLSEADRQAAAGDLDFAADCIDEVIKFIPSDRDDVPLNRFLTADDIQFFYIEPGRFIRLRLDAVRRTYRSRAAALRAPTH